MVAFEDSFQSRNLSSLVNLEDEDKETEGVVYL